MAQLIQRGREILRINTQKNKEEKDGNYLHEMFGDNLFYHPYHLMGQGKNHPKSQFLLNTFCQNTTSPKY